MAAYRAQGVVTRRLPLGDGRAGLVARRFGYRGFSVPLTATEPAVVPRLLGLPVC